MQNILQQNTAPTCSRGGFTQKITQKQAEESFASEGYKLLSQYKNAHTKLDYVCDNGHTHSISWSSWNAGHRCKYCNLDKSDKKQDEVKQSFADAQYKLLSDYRDYQTKLNFICPNGHEGSISWRVWITGWRCLKCKPPSDRKARQVEAFFKDNGYQLLDSYKDCKTKMRTICPNGHGYMVSWTNFNIGSRCKQCCHNAPISESTVIEALANEGYKLVSPYVNVKTKFTVECPQGHYYQTNFDTWKHKGCRCVYCFSNTPPTQEFVEQSFANEGYQVFGKYEKSGKKLEFLCPNGHNGSMTWNGWQQGRRCRQCSNLATDDLNFVIESLASEGYKLVSEFKRNAGLITVKCPNNHEWDTKFTAWKRGVRCLYCSNQAPITQKDVEESFSNEGYTLLSDYKNARSPLEFICPEGHKHKMAWDSWRSGTRCGYCYGRHKTDEGKEINEIKDRIIWSINRSMRCQKLGRTFSKSSFADRIASNIHKALGDRPDGHHLDHIIPRSFFDHRNMTEIKACWDVANLQWLPARENASKSNKLTIADAQKLTPHQKSLLAIASLKPKRLNKVL